MGDAQNKEHMSEKDIANELVIEPAMRSVGILCNRWQSAFILVLQVTSDISKALLAF